MARVVLLLSYAPGQPEGDLTDRLDLTMPLTAQGALDDGAAAERWQGTRTLPDGRVRSVEVVQAEGAWALRGAEGEDAPLWDFEGRIFRPGEYVTLRRPNGTALVFRIVEVQPD